MDRDPIAGADDLTGVPVEIVEPVDVMDVDLVLPTLVLPTLIRENYWCENQFCRDLNKGFKYSSQKRNHEKYTFFSYIG